MTDAITIEIAPGELVDKLTILEIKLARIAEPAKRENVAREYAVLTDAYDAVDETADVEALRARLKGVNEALWQIEDDIRDCERLKDFGERFVTLARAVYKTNDERAEIKRAINLALDSRLIEEKSYRPYL